MDHVIYVQNALTYTHILHFISIFRQNILIAINVAKKIVLSKPREWMVNYLFISIVLASFNNQTHWRMLPYYCHTRPQTWCSCLIGAITSVNMNLESNLECIYHCDWLLLVHEVNDCLVTFYCWKYIHDELTEFYIQNGILDLGNSCHIYLTWVAIIKFSIFFVNDEGIKTMVTHEYKMFYPNQHRNWMYLMHVHDNSKALLTDLDYDYSIR